MRTLHLRNLPKRPASNDRFTRLLLNSINPDNKYARDFELALPQINLDQLPEQYSNAICLPGLMQDREAFMNDLKSSLIDKNTNFGSTTAKTLLNELFDTLKDSYLKGSVLLSIGDFKKLLNNFQQHYSSVEITALKENEEFNKKLKYLKQAFCKMKFLPILDDEFSIISISRVCVEKGVPQGFMTFLDPISAEQFMEKFKGNLVVRGHKIAIQFAKQESILGVYLDKGRSEFEKLTRKRNHEKKLHLKVEALIGKKEQRHLRRLRHRLRAKGLTEDQIKSAEEKFKASKQAPERIPKKRPNLSPTEAPKKKMKVVLETSGNPPNKILLVQNLPSGVTPDEMNSIFQGDGLQEIRLVDVRNLAFVEYDSKESATIIKSKLGPSCKLGDTIISIGFAK